MVIQDSSSSLSLSLALCLSVGKDFSAVFKNYIIRKAKKETISSPPTVTGGVYREPEPMKVAVAEKEIAAEEGKGEKVGSHHQSKDLNVAIESLVEGVQGLVSNQSPVLGNGGHHIPNETTQHPPAPSASSNNQTPPLLFVDDESDSETLELNNFPRAQNQEQREGGGGVVKREMTLREATYLFPALAKPGRVAKLQMTFHPLQWLIQTRF